MRRAKIHTNTPDALAELIDHVALRRNVASAVPDICFRERFGWPVPIVVLDELERIRDTDALAAGRPTLVPEE